MTLTFLWTLIANEGTSKDHIVRSKNSGSVYGFRGEGANTILNKQTSIWPIASFGICRTSFMFRDCLPVCQGTYYMEYNKEGRLFFPILSWRIYWRRPTSYYSKVKLLVGGEKPQAPLFVWRMYFSMYAFGVISREVVNNKSFRTPSCLSGVPRILPRWRPGIWSGKKLKYMHLSHPLYPFLLRISASPEILVLVIGLSEYLRSEFKAPSNLIILFIWYTHRPNLLWPLFGTSMAGHWPKLVFEISEYRELLYFNITFLAGWNNRRGLGWDSEGTRIHKSPRCFFSGALTFTIRL